MVERARRVDGHAEPQLCAAGGLARRDERGVVAAGLGPANRPGADEQRQLELELRAHAQLEPRGVCGDCSTELNDAGGERPCRPRGRLARQALFGVEVQDALASR